MKELIIYEYQAKHIEDTFRLIANALNCRSKETCLDRQVCKAIDMINDVLSKLKDQKQDSTIKTMKNEDFPRRNRLDLNTPAELVIRHAVTVVESVGADERLTRAIMLLNEAKDLVSDYVDETIAVSN